MKIWILKKKEIVHFEHLYLNFILPMNLESQIMGHFSV